MKNRNKEYPMFTGLIKYFPDALRYVSHVSYVANEQHNKGKPVHWDRAKSTDEADALVRHLSKSGDVDDDGLLHTGKVAWRALALLQKEIENQASDLVQRCEPICLKEDLRYDLGAPSYDEFFKNSEFYEEPNEKPDCQCNI